jgi:hypothetical protein
MHVAVLSLLVCVRAIVLNYIKDILCCITQRLKKKIEFTAVDVRLNDGKGSKSSVGADF